MDFERFLILSAVLFCIGLYGALARRNVIVVLMSIELMFNAVNIALVAMSRFLTPMSVSSHPTSSADIVVQTLLVGQVFAIFIIAVSAAEVALGLGIVIALYRQRETVDISETRLLKL